jgi:hypothetical protein
MSRLSQPQLAAKKRVTNSVAKNRLRDRMTEFAAFNDDGLPLGGQPVSHQLTPFVPEASFFTQL